MSEIIVLIEGSKKFVERNLFIFEPVYEKYEIRLEKSRAFHRKVNYKCV